MNDDPVLPAEMAACFEKGPRRPRCADAAVSHHFASSNVLAAALVDGSGRTEEVAEFASLAADVAARVAARRGATAGVLAATEMNRDDTVEFPKPDGAIVVAVVRHNQPIVVAHAGDSGARSYRDGQLVAATTLHTKGQRLREQGVAEDAASKVDNVLIGSIGRATIGTVVVSEMFGDTVVLACDGVLQYVSPEEMGEILQEFPDLEECVINLVARARLNGSMDDASVIVIRRTSVPERGGEGVLTGR